MDVLAIDANFVGVDALSRHAFTFASGHAVFPAVPWAGDGAVGAKAVTEWATTVNASVVERVKSTIDVEQSDGHSIHLAYSTFTWRNVVSLCSPCKIGHLMLLLLNGLCNSRILSWVILLVKK